MGLGGFGYVTMQGDTFDMLALDAYNDEFKAVEIIRANPNHANTIIFEAGIELWIPEVLESPPESLPPWKR